MDASYTYPADEFLATAVLPLLNIAQLSLAGIPSVVVPGIRLRFQVRCLLCSVHRSGLLGTTTARNHTRGYGYGEGQLSVSHSKLLIVLSWPDVLSVRSLPFLKVPYLLFTPIDMFFLGPMRTLYALLIFLSRCRIYVDGEEDGEARLLNHMLTPGAIVHDVVESQHPYANNTNRLVVQVDRSTSLPRLSLLLLFHPANRLASSIAADRGCFLLWCLLSHGALGVFSWSHGGAGNYAASPVKTLTIIIHTCLGSGWMTRLTFFAGGYFSGVFVLAPLTFFFCSHGGPDADAASPR